MAESSAPREPDGFTPPDRASRFISRPGDSVFVEPGEPGPEGARDCAESRNHLVASSQADERGPTTHTNPRGSSPSASKQWSSSPGT